MKLERAKGTKDILPEEMILRQDMLAKIRTTFELYGYAPFETPVIERFDVLTAKFAAGEGTDVMKEIFRLTDQGERELALKFDQTVPLARFIAMNPTIKLPFKRYTIDKAFRDGPIKLGRTREFYQCDVDIVGSTSMMCEAELMDLTNDVFKALDLDVTIEINSRKLMGAMLSHCGIEEEKHSPVTIIIDKFKKLTRDELEKEFKEHGLSDDQIKALYDLFSLEGTNTELLDAIEGKVGRNEGVDEMREILSYVQNENVTVSPTLARGLNYYTGPVFEAFLKDSSITSSVSGGGRYDKMIGGYANRDIPAVGTSFGLSPITEALKQRVEKTVQSVSTILIIPIKQYEKGLEVARSFRRQGLNTDIDLMKRGISKNLDYANNYGIPYVAFIGEDEVKQNKVKLRNMGSGEEELVSPDEVGELIDRWDSL